MKPLCILPVVIFASLLVGCEQRQARMHVRDAVAAMKVCTKGASFSEFHQKRQELETQVESNGRYVRADFRRLTELMNACDVCWEWSLNVLKRPIPTRVEWEAIKTISPEITNATRTSDYELAVELWKRQAQEAANVRAKLRVQLDAIGQVYGEKPGDRLSAKIDRDWEKIKERDRRADTLSMLPDVLLENGQIASAETDPSTHARRALTLIHAECDRLLGQLQ